MSEEVINDETIVGIHSSGIQLQEGLNTSNSTYRCSSCKKKIHCYVTIDRETNEAKIHNTCKDKVCECKCKTHYACKSCGYLHPYGSECNRVELEPIRDPKKDAEWEKLLTSFKTEDKENETDAGEGINENL